MSADLIARLSHLRWAVPTAAVAAAATKLLLACGPFFPIELTVDRSTELTTAPEPHLRSDLTLLVGKASSPLPVGPQRRNDSPYEEQTETATEAFERQSLSADGAAKVKAMRALEDGGAAFTLGEGLPPAIREYTAGAVSFHHDAIEDAQRHFAAVLALPDAQRQARELWARYMLGRIAAKAGDVAAAEAQFAATRALVRGGAPDSLGVAVASLGEEARLHLRPGELARAVKLYAEQASYGSDNGLNSLVRVAAKIGRQPAWLDEGIQDPLTRRVLLIYAYHQATDVFEQLKEDEPQASGEEARAEDVAPAATTRADEKIPPLVDRIVAALERHGITDSAGASSLAAAAYAQGRFDVAERLAVRERTPLSAWLRAKLALRGGDRARAAALYAEALPAFERAGARPEDISRVRAEAAVLRLARGDYVQALEAFYRAASDAWKHARRDTNYWMDAAYVAERVLTIDELQRFVDGALKTQVPSAAELDRATEEGREIPAVSLRSLLARRLMRAGRYDEALAYFDDEYARSVAVEYAATIRRATSRWRFATTRAEAWFTAATIARFEGMEILGFELEPDYAVWNGAYAGFAESGEKAGAESKDDARVCADAEPGLCSKDEAARVTQSKPNPPARFQYRLTAVDHAMKAADLVPRTSEAFAAVLCKATAWVANREPQRAAVVYERYLREGPYVRWGKSFGVQCPQPDFEAAERRRWIDRWHVATTVVKTHRITSAAAGLIAAVLAAWYALTRLQRRRSAHAPASANAGVQAGPG